MKLILMVVLLASSSLALAWQPGDLQENFEDIRAAQRYGQQQAEQSRIEAQQMEQDRRIQRLEVQQLQVEPRQVGRNPRD